MLTASLLAFGTASASVAPAPQYLYFNADCTDCALAANTNAYNVVATLELDGYNYGFPLFNGNFFENGNVVSFSYSGSNLVSPFQVFAQRAGEKSLPAGSTINSISGQINTGLDWPEPTNGVLDIIFGGNGQRFTIAEDGNWAYFAGSDLPNDYGHGTWSLTTGPVGSQGQQIPEPGSLALCGIAMLATLLACLRHRYRRLLPNDVQKSVHQPLTSEPLPKLERLKGHIFNRVVKVICWLAAIACTPIVHAYQLEVSGTATSPYTYDPITGEFVQQLITRYYSNAVPDASTQWGNTSTNWANVTRFPEPSVAVGIRNNADGLSESSYASFEYDITAHGRPNSLMNMLFDGKFDISSSVGRVYGDTYADAGVGLFIYSRPAAGQPPFPQTGFAVSLANGSPYAWDNELQQIAVGPNISHVGSGSFGIQGHTSIEKSTSDHGWRDGATSRVYGNFSGWISISLDSEGIGYAHVRLNGSAHGTGLGDFASAFIDPYLQISPEYLLDHPDSRLDIEDGIGNTRVNLFSFTQQQVPEPGSLVLIGLGLAGLGGIRLSAKRK